MAGTNAPPNRRRGRVRLQSLGLLAVGLLGSTGVEAQPTPAPPAPTARSDGPTSPLQAAETAFVRAVLDHRAEKAAYDAAAAERDAARWSASEARSRIEAAYAERVSAAEREVSEAQAAFEAAQAMPAVSEPEATAAKALEDARRELSAANGLVRTLEGELSAATRAVAATIARIGELQSRLDELQATISSLSRQDALTAAEVTPEMLRMAQEEDAQLAAILDEFHPAMEAARRTARINIGMHLPTIFRTRARIDGMAPLVFCRAKREHLQAYVRLSTEGIEQFQTLRGDAATIVTVALMSLADESLAKYRTTNCTSPAHVAAATTAMRSTRLADARREADQVEANLVRENRLGDEIEARKAALPGRIAAARQDAARRSADVDAAEVVMRVNAARFQAATAAVRQAREAATETASARLQQVSRARQALLAESAAEIAAIEAAIAPQVEAERAADGRLKEADRVLTAQRGAFGEALAADYVRRHVRVGTRVPPYTWDYSPQLCAEISNTGSLAIVSAGTQLTMRNQVLPPEILQIVAGGNLRIYPEATNEYRERIYGLPPQRTYRAEDYSSGCYTIRREAATSGDGMRALERFGGFARSSSEWRIIPGSFVLALPQTLTRSGPGWRYSSEPAHVVFAAEVARVEVAAIRSAASARPAAALVATAPSAAAAASVPLASLDRQTAAKVQAALNARGFNVGVVDGSPGPRTREALRAWQTSRREPATGDLTPAQLRELAAEP